MLITFVERFLSWAMNHIGTLLFGLIWITITVAAAISVGLAIRRVAAPMSQKTTRRSSDLILPWRQAAAPRTVAALALVAAFLASYIAMILVWEDFAYYDDSMLTLSTLNGHNFIPAIWPEGGRFFPLGLQEFNLIRHFTNTAAGYHVLTIAQLLVFCWILLVLDDELNIASRATLLVLALLTPSTLISFNGFTFQERDVLFFLACLLLSVKRFEQTQSIAWALAAVVCVQIMMYCKETAFLLVLGFAASRLVFRCRNEHLAGRGHGLRASESRLDLCLACLAVLFLILYFGFVGNGNMSYAASARLPRADVVLGYLKVDLLPWLLLAVVLCRIYLMLWHPVAPMLLWDGLALSGLICFFAYLYLSIFGVYYLAPVDLIAVLYVGRFAVLSLGHMRSWGKIGAVLLALVVLFQNLLVSAFAVFERKNVIHATAQIGSIVETQYRRGNGNGLGLFFPFSGGEEIMEFGAYLTYRGVPVEGAEDGAPGPTSVVFTRRGTAKDGPCVGWRSFICRWASEPAPGDLVIVLPDDGASRAEASLYRERRGKPLFWYNPPCIPQWLYWVFDNLQVGAESRYRYDALPDRWMDASVTVWK
jgi:hypothetical protein